MTEICLQWSPKFYRYENCTETDGETPGQIDPGHTLCQNNSDISITPASSDLPLIYVDHAAYGRPPRPPESSVNRFCKNYYASEQNEVRNLFF